MWGFNLLNQQPNLLVIEQIFSFFLCAGASPHLLDVGQALGILANNFHVSIINDTFSP
jgi:hypothetical protein